MPTQHIEKSVTLCFINGDSTDTGMLTAEMGLSWAGHVLSFPRSQIPQALKRDASNRRGVYILLGDKDDKPCAYIGEAGNNIADRIRNHGTKKGWWDISVIITTKGNDLTKTYTQYLEFQLIKKAQDVDRIMLDNKVTPDEVYLPESDKAGMGKFLENLFFVLPIIGVDMFESKRPNISKKSDKGSPIFVIHRKGLMATAKIVDNKFVVSAGSDANSKWVTPGSSSTEKKYSELVDSGVLKEENNKRKFVSDCPFNSPSQAGGVVFGTSCNGQTEWKIKGTNKQYKDWEKDNLNLNKGHSAVKSGPLPPLARGSATVNRESSPTFELKFPKEGLVAKMEVRDDKLFVLAGSDARQAWQNPGAENTMPTEENYNRLVESGVLVLTAEGDKRKFTSDCGFDKPSRAGGVVLGKGCNGKTAWKIVGSKKTYGEWKEENYPKKK